MVSPLFAETLRIALDAADETEGLVRPTLGGALEAAGYTRDSSMLTPDPAPPATPPQPTGGSVFALGRVVGLEPGVALDLNGVVKSLAVDDALALMHGDGFVSAGGDVAARGELTVELPGEGSVSLRRGALATSGSTKRWWLRAGQVQHHLIDPRTGRPAETPWSQVTACGASCLAADIAAKAGFLMGERGPGWLDRKADPGSVPHRRGRGHGQRCMAVEHARGGSVHLTSSPIDWYAARAGGIVAYVLLSANVAIGLSMTGKKSMKHWPRFALEDVHRFGGILVGTFLVVHITAVAIDAYLPFSLTSLVVPLVASYRPIWTALGIVAAELLLALAFTNHYRNVEISYRFWRRAHFVNFVVWGSATLHGLGSGTDRSAAWFVSIYAVAVGTVCALTVWRVLRRWHPSPEWVLRLAPVTAALIAVVTIGGLARGPLRFQPKEWNAASFSDTLDGKILVNNGVTRGMVSMAGNGSGSQRVLVRADLLVSPQRLVSTEFQMEYLPSGALCKGP